MKRFFAFVYKEILHIKRDPRTLLILIGMPAVQLLLFGYAITNEIRDARIAILDLSKDSETQKITNKMLSSGYFILYEYLNSYDDIEKAFKKGKIKIALVFENNFAENLTKQGTANIQLISDATDPNTGSSLQNYTQSIINNYLLEENKLAAIPLRVNVDVKMRYNEELKGTFLFVPGLITMLLMLISAMMTSISLTREKEIGAMELLLVSPMKPIQVIIAKVVPYLVLGFIDGIIILAFGNLVFGVVVRGSLLLLFIEGIIFITSALTLGILISSIANSQQVALIISLMGLMLPTMLLSDFIYPIANMPEWLQVITNIIPARWFNVIIKDIMLKGSSLEYIYKETLILIGFTVFFIIVSVKKYKVRLQ